MSAEEIFRRFASRILFLTCDVSEDEGKLASGVLISKDGFVATNAHVVEGCRMITAIHINGASRQSFVAVLKYYDQTSDTAVLKLDGQDWDHFDPPSRSVRIGERVYAIGNPRGFEQSISEGIVSGERQADGASWIQHSAPISPGSSGGALISSRGELLGINSWARKDSQNLNFAVPAETLVRALAAGRERVIYLKFPPTREDLISLTPARVRALTEEAGHGNADSTAVLTNAAELGNVEAEVMLGGLYLLGSGVPHDYALAAIWTRRAADQGDVRAEYSLGKMYLMGEGVLQDHTEGTAWFRRAAEQGYATAQFSLGVDYLNGQGVPQNYSEAYFWVKVAAAGEVPDAKPEDIAAVLDRLIAPHLTAADLVREQKRAREWVAAHAVRVK